MRLLHLLPLLLTSLPAQEVASIRSPDRFAIIFNMGYAGDHLPKDKAGFERLIRAIKSAHFNVVLCKWEDWRAKICKKHNVQITAVTSRWIRRPSIVTSPMSRSTWLQPQ